MAGSTIDHMISVTILIAALLVTMVMYNQMFASAVAYDRDRHVTQKAVDLIQTICLSPGSPDDWGRSSATLVGFGLGDPEQGGYTVSPFSTMRLRTKSGGQDSPLVYYPKTGEYYNNFELKEDPNVRNFWGQSLDSMWTNIFEAEGGLGGAIWCMLDETFMLPEDLPGQNQWWGILDKNIIPATYMGPCVGYGEWGIVDTWRRKKPEFWGTKKAYSPARILVKQIESFEPNTALTIPVHNRFDHTNFNELKITWYYAGHTGQLDSFNLEPHEKGQLVIPAKPWKEGEKLHIGFYQNDTLLVDRYNIQLGNRKFEMPECKEGNLKVEEEEEKIYIAGSGFGLEVNKLTGLLENVTILGDTMIESGPYINLRVPGKRHQYSTIAMDDYEVDWKCREFGFELDKGIATIHAKGTYQKLKAGFTIRIDEHGTFDISYEVEGAPGGKTIQESGLKFITGNSLVKLAWDRNPYFTAYPETHMGRPVGEVDLTVKPEMRYREKPDHGWELDSRGFYYFGLEKELPYSNVVRSLKENINHYTLVTKAKSGIKVYSEGAQACRFDQIDGENTLIINDQWDYNSLLWGNYMKKIPLNRAFQGRVTIAVTE